MHELTPAERLSLLREAGHVERAHTLPHHGSYSVGKHSFDMALLLLVLHPNPRPELLKAVLTHDLGERFTGDMPHPAKRLDGEIGKRLDRLERLTLERLEADYVSLLTADERLWLVSLDRVEFILWCKDQIALGNANAAAPYGAAIAELTMSEMPPELEEFVQTHVWTRHPDTFPG